jgi:hypothetical protein
MRRMLTHMAVPPRGTGDTGLSLRSVAMTTVTITAAGRRAMKTAAGATSIYVRGVPHERLRKVAEE